MTVATLATPAVWRPAVTRGALLLMETLWVYAFAAFFIAATADGGHPSPLGAAVIVFCSFGISRLLQLSDLSLGIVRLWGVILSFLIFYAVIRVDFFGDWRFWDFGWADSLFRSTEATVRARTDAAFGIPLLWAFWIRGVLRGQQRTGFEDVVGSFAVGIGVIAVVELFASGTGDAPDPVSLVPVPYVAIGLLAIALSHAARSEDEFSRSFAPTWIMAVGGALLGLGLIALLFILIDYGAAVNLMADIGMAVGWVVGRIFYYVTWPFLWITEQGFTVFRWIFENLWGGERREQFQEESEEEQQQQEEDDSQPLPAWLRLLIRIFIGGTIVTALIIATGLLFTRYRRREAPQEVKESIYQEGRLASDLGSLLGSLIGKLRPNFHLGGENLDPARRLYYDVLSAAEQRGVERQTGETPLELSPRLESTFAASTPRQITEVFDDVRYGALPPPAEEVQRLRQEWESQRR
jgi:hypothetical protein